MPPKTGGGGGAAKKRNQSLDNQARQSTNGKSANGNGVGHGGKNPLATKTAQPKFTITPLILEGVKVSKLQLNDILKQHMKDIRISDIQLSRSGMFTLYATDVSSFNRLLNEFSSILATNGQAGAKIFVPRSIQRIKDTEKVAFVKRVDLEIPESRITEALKEVGLDVVDVIRLTNKDRNMPMSTIKITFNDPENRNTFVHTGLQVDSMHFTAEPAMQNVKPVQCYICLNYNHVAKYCKTKQQICARCGENHKVDQCTAASDLLKCCNCKGNHLATSNECSKYKEQEKRMLNLINQHSTTNKPTITVPALNNDKEFPSLPNIYQRQHELLHNDIFDELINALTNKMEKVIEDMTSRLFKSFQLKIKKIEKTISTIENIINVDKIDSDSDSDSEDENRTITDKNGKPKQPMNVVKFLKNKNNPPTTSASANTTTTTTQLPVTTNDTSIKPPRKQKATAKTGKRNRSPNSSLESTAIDNKDLKASINED